MNEPKKKIDVASLIVAGVGLLLSFWLPLLSMPPLLAAFIIGIQRRKQKVIVLTLVLSLLGLIVAIVHASIDGVTLFTGMAEYLGY